MLENQRENLIKIIYHHRLLRNLIDFPGEGELLLSNGGIAPSLFFGSIPKKDSQKTQQVKLVRGDDFIRQNNLPLPQAIKTDVEGYEYRVLLGLEKTLRSEICQIVLL